MTLKCGPERSAGAAELETKTAQCALLRGRKVIAQQPPIMKTKLYTCFMFSSALMAGSALAQTTSAVATPPAPAPTQPTVTPTEPMAPATVNQTVYGQRLPTVDELSNAAAAQGLTVVRIEKTATQITATYRYPSGQVNTVAYLVLANGSTAPAQVVSPTSPPPPTVYYYNTAPTRVVYYDDCVPAAYYYGYPRYWYPSFSVGLGFRGGGYYGGYHGGGGHGGGHRGGPRH
eukprot:TRINITY_DN29052_c0_g1_i1.p1 TRINITY_DN29052_c0_g1~~TRINITY_DN29052_c0_g1_i1.p1  ORF type:complete len:231 (+),score=8.60 TRINITY_DN29052_c0_g1_i1:257-949(+)